MRAKRGLAGGFALGGTPAAAPAAAGAAALARGCAAGCCRAACGGTAGADDRGHSVADDAGAAARPPSAGLWRCELVRCSGAAAAAGTHPRFTSASSLSNSAIWALTCTEHGGARERQQKGAPSPSWLGSARPAAHALAGQHAGEGTALRGGTGTMQCCTHGRQQPSNSRWYSSIRQGGGGSPLHRHQAGWRG